jgi:WD40 repeat protein
MKWVRGASIAMCCVMPAVLLSGAAVTTAEAHSSAAAPVPSASQVTPAAQQAGQNKLPAVVVPQTGHASIVKSVAMSPDGRTALSGSNDNTLKLWDVATGQELRTFTGHTGEVKSLAFSPDGGSVLSGSGDNTVKLWDLATGQELRTFQGHSGAVRSVAFFPDGRKFLSGSADKTVKVWDIATGREIRTFTRHAGTVVSVAISPNGQTALSSGTDKTLKLWDTRTGKELRNLAGHSEMVHSAAISPDGRTAISGSGDNTLKVWDIATGQELRTITGHSVISVAISQDGRTAISGGFDSTLRLWDIATGEQLRVINSPGGFIYSVAISPDGRTALSGGLGNIPNFWNTATGLELRTSKGYSGWVHSVAISPDGRTAISASSEAMKLWDTATGQMLRTFTGHSNGVKSAAVSPDGRTILSAGIDHTLKLWTTTTGHVLRTLEGHAGPVNSIAMSPDGRTAVSGSSDNALKLWNIATGEELRTFTGHSKPILSVAYSPAGRTALSGSEDNTVKLWDMASGRELRTFENAGFAGSVAFSPDGRKALSASSDKTAKLWDTATGQKLRTFTGHTGLVVAVAISPDGRTALSGSVDQTLKLWDIATGKELRTFTGHFGVVRSIAYSPDGRTALSGSFDRTVRIWDLKNGNELAQMVAEPDGGWLTMTPEGFYSSSHRDTDTLAIVRGVEATAIGQVHQSLFSPDLVREALAGDPDGEVKRAAQVVSLEKVLDAGPPPAAAITSHAPGSRSGQDLVTVTARITDRSKGLGRIEWRVNGVTAGVMAKPAGPGPDYDVQRQLALDPGENQIEVIAYEERNLLASLPARTSITYDGPADTVKPKLHILAIGINAYVDQGWTPPGSADKLAFPPLKLAVADAKAFGEEMQKAGAGLYSEVHVIQALDTDATPAGLDALIEKIAAGTGPRDTFVLYAAAHGTSLDGRYYLIPQDFQGGTDPQALKTRAIGQERLQDWIANRIKAKKAVILLDTCESGALVGGHTKSRTDVPASEAAIGRLHEATGRPVLTAAATGKPAFEGYKGHGVFTYALMEALRLGDANNNGRIEVTELAAHVARRVPELAAEVDKHGVVKGVAVTAMRGASGDKQSAHFGSTGEDFAVADRLP